MFSAYQQRVVKEVPIESGLQHLNPTNSQCPLWNFGAKVQSQNTEDGILYYIFSVIGVKSRFCVEICAGDGIENNTANLIMNHGFSGLLFDGDSASIERGKKHYEQLGIRDRGCFIHAWLTRDNIAGLIKQHLPPSTVYPLQIDLLSLDMDGVDYWILDALLKADVIRPRVIVVEYQDIIGYERALTVPYDSAFNAQKHDTWCGPNYAGASLRAFIHLLGQHYAFIGCERLGFNGFFVAREELKPTLPLQEMNDIRPCFEAGKVRFGMEQRWPRVKDKQWIDVTKQIS